MTKNCNGYSEQCIRLFLICLIILSACKSDAYAAPVINNISVQEQAIRLGNANTVYINCTDNSSTITGVYADINTSEGMFLNNTFTKGTGDIYGLSISTMMPSKFWASGFFNVSGYCTNSLGETANSNTSFLVVNKTIVLDRTINLSIDSFDLGRIGYFDYNQEIRQYSRINITVEFINTGSTRYLKKTELDIYGVVNGTFTILYNRSGATRTLNPGERSVEKLRYTPMTPGYYWIRIFVHYAENKTANAWGIFHVTPYYESAYGPVYVPGPPAPPRTIEIETTIQLPNPTEEVLPAQENDRGIKGMTVSYPYKANITPGESSTIYVIVKNEGTMPLRELMILSRINGDISIDVQPKIVQTLYGGRSAVLMITMDALPGTPEGVYSLDFTVHTDKMSENGHIDVTVGKTSIDDELARTILNYQYILSKLEEEMDSLNIEGTDTSKILPHIDEAKNRLKLAKEAYKIKDYEKTRDNLKRTRNSLINAVIELALARNETSQLIVMALTIWLLIILLIIIIIAAIALYMHKRDTERTKKKEGEESLEGQA